MASPKAQRTGGLDYDPVDFPKEELKKTLVKIYKQECEKQTALFKKYLEEKEKKGVEVKCSMPLNGEQDIKLAEDLGICGPRVEYIYGPQDKTQYEKDQIIYGPWTRDRENSKTLGEHLRAGGTFAELFAAELIEILRPCYKSVQAVTLLCRRADLKEEAQGIQRKIESLIKDLGHLSPGILWDDRLIRKELNPMLREAAESFDRAAREIDKRDRKAASKDEIARIAHDMSVQALQVFIKYNVSVTASAEKIGETTVYTSIAVDVLTALHKTAGFPHDEQTMNKRIKLIKKESIENNGLKEYF